MIPSHRSAEKVKFFFVGVGKCGTSWIFEVVRRKGIMSVPRIKEPYLIDAADGKRDRMVRNLYSSFQQMADFSNTYFWDRDNAEKIRTYNPDAKIILTVRLPSRRIVSHFEFLRRNGQHTDISLAEYLERGDDEDIVARSNYRPLFERYVDAMGRDNVLVLPLEDLKSDQQKYFDRLTDFCGFDRVELSDEDKAPVLQRATTRSPWLANLAKTVAVGLRKVGMLRLLGRLKDSRLIQQVLFQQNATGERDTDFGIMAGQIEEMDEDYHRLLRELGIR